MEKAPLISKTSPYPVGLYEQIDYKKVRAIIFDENGKKVEVSGEEFLEYFKPENTEERVRRLALHLRSPEVLESMNTLNQAIGEYLISNSNGKWIND